MKEWEFQLSKKQKQPRSNIGVLNLLDDIHPPQPCPDSEAIPVCL
jgi:hypothetical protein